MSRILVVDDHAVLRQGIAMVLGREQDLEVVGEAGTPSEAEAEARRLEPDLVLLDLGLGQGGGLELISRIQEATPAATILVLSMFDEMIYAERCLRAGASGYVMKEEASRTLVDAIRRALGGEIVVSDEVRRRLVRRMAGRSDDGSALEALSDRELQVFRMLGSGQSSREIAADLGLSVKTVENHRSNIMRKLGLENANQLVHRAVVWVHGESGMPSES